MIMQRLRWQQCVVRVSKTKEIPYDGDLDDVDAVHKAIDANRTFHTFSECMDDSELHVQMREHGCEDLFYEMTGFKPR